MLVRRVAVLCRGFAADFGEGEGGDESLPAHGGLEVCEVCDVGEDVCGDVGVQVNGTAFELDAVVAFGDAFEGYLEGRMLAAVPGVWVAVLLWGEFYSGGVSGSPGS